MDDYTGLDFYCDVAVPNRGRLTIVRETQAVLAFRHTRPRWETHIVVAPKAHITSLTSITAADLVVVRELLEVVQEAARVVESATGGAG